LTKNTQKKRIKYVSSNWWRVWFLVVQFTHGLPLLGCLLARTLVLAPCFFFSPFYWVLSFYKALPSLVDMLHATGGGQLVECQFLVVPFFPCSSPLLVFLLAQTLVLAPCFFFSPFCWVLSFYKAPLFLVDMLHATGGGQLVEGSVLSGSLFSLSPGSFGLFACLDFGSCLLCFFLSLSWVFSFYKVRKGFIDIFLKSGVNTSFCHLSMKKACQIKQASSALCDVAILSNTENSSNSCNYLLKYWHISPTWNEWVPAIITFRIMGFFCFGKIIRWLENPIPSFAKLPCYNTYHQFFAYY
jgi:hypothetical protein